MTERDNIREDIPVWGVIAAWLIFCLSVMAIGWVLI